VEKIRKEADLFSFLKKHVSGPLKCHHEFRITFADCPNACSQPQIKDIGIIGASKPCVTDQECTHCDACTETCPDPAILLPHDRGPQIDDRRCLACGQCLMICPTGTLIESQKGFRIQLAGKLGRHPKLARELPSLYSKPEVLSIVTHCLDLYKKRRAGGQRFADFFTQPDRDQLIALFDRSS
jgi:dissimilatory sulfite reductase (desulfoviridin) alpha/beta subunit